MKKNKIILWGLFSFFLVVIYFLSRLIAIKSLPPFVDELIYVRWAQQGFYDPAMRFLSLSDGKQPLYIWIMSMMLSVFPNPLAVGRILSVFSGAISMIGLGVLSWQLFGSKRVAFIAAGLYIVYPLALLLDRFALYDSFLGALVLWSVIILLWFVRSPTLGKAFIAAHIWAAALLTKSSAVLLGILLPAATLLYPIKKVKIMQTVMFLGIAAIFTVLYQSILLLSPIDSYIQQKNTLFIYSWKEWIDKPLGQVFLANIIPYTTWIIQYISLPLVLVAILTSMFDKANRSAYRFLGVWFVVPFLLIVITGKLIYPRHLFFLTFPILLTAAVGISILSRHISSWWRTGLIVSLILLPSILMNNGILTNMRTASIPQVDREQYIDGWSAGWGVKEIVLLLQQEAAVNQITIVTEGSFGSLPTTAMELYFAHHPNVSLVRLDDNPLKFPVGLDWRKPTFIIINNAQEIPGYWEAREIQKFQKGTGDSYIRLYKVTKTNID
jgi:hypothetical protein